jgi:hypothetical protein
VLCFLVEGFSARFVVRAPLRTACRPMGVRRSTATVCSFRVGSARNVAALCSTSFGALPFSRTEQC